MDYEATKGIINKTQLNTTSTEQANQCLINVLIYLLVYPFDVYHLPSRYNLVPDALSWLKVARDDQIQECNEELVLDAF